MADKKQKTKSIFKTSTGESFTLCTGEDDTDELVADKKAILEIDALVKSGSKDYKRPCKADYLKAQKQEGKK